MMAEAAPVALVEVPYFAESAQLGGQVGPPGHQGRRGRVGVADAAHARQLQLPEAVGDEVFRGNAAPAREVIAGPQYDR